MHMAGFSAQDLTDGNQDVSRAGFLSKGSGEESATKFTQTVS